MEELRAQLREFRERDWFQANERGASTMESLANALEGLPKASPREKKLRALRSASGRLRQATSTSLETAQIIREGLEAAYAVLEQFSAQCDLPIERTQPWLGSAKRAVSAIDGRGLVTFQRAAVQDAFRTTADALTVVSRIDSKCGAAAAGPTQPDH